MLYFSLPQVQVIPCSRAAISRSSERTSYMITLSAKGSGSSPCSRSLAPAMASCSISCSTAYSSPIKQQSCFVPGQARPMPLPCSSLSAPHSALCSSPQMPHGTLRRNFPPSASIVRLDLPHAQLTTAPEAESAKALRPCITLLWHTGHRYPIVRISSLILFPSETLLNLNQVIIHRRNAKRKWRNARFSTFFCCFAHFFAAIAS